MLSYEKANTIHPLVQVVGDLIEERSKLRCLLEQYDDLLKSRELVPTNRGAIKVNHIRHTYDLLKNGK